MLISLLQINLAVMQANVHILLGMQTTPPSADIHSFYNMTDLSWWNSFITTLMTFYNIYK